jgi:integrase
MVQFGRDIRRRFPEYSCAEAWLDQLRYEKTQGSFDPRDHLSKSPHSFIKLSDRWLKRKENSVAPGTYRLLRCYIRKAQQFFGDTNIKAVDYALLEDWLDTLPVSDKTRANYLSCVHNFYSWLRSRKKITAADFPEFPTVRYELKFRKTISKETQLAVLEKIRQATYEKNPKVWLAVRWLTVYIALRPEELRNVRERDIDLDRGTLLIPHPKERRPKIIPLLPDDLVMVEELPRALPDIYFFRHPDNGIRPGPRFGKRYLYIQWRKACEELGIEGVDLYGGTRHSSAIALRHHATPEQIRQATMHSTSKAFERYYRTCPDELQRLYGLAEGHVL